ncbi:hypothetical protein EJP69_22875 [Variovorax gossypii]|uniref:Uncharacterized protein n=1 Tax=Variovorax gossypii TaxID=1679495 RepID=A0A431TFZ0_9BURK|nr:hypothetical protein [Variovorax gossypii]RTQ32121.1 hypothetical protein EJP69_22875 [Variovorax gossypii]
MKTARRALTVAALSILGALFATQADAATYRVDDTGTVVSQAVTQMRWRQPVPGRIADNTVEAQLSVALRLNLSQWVMRQARIYMLLAPTENERLVVTWRTQGRLLPGSMRGGDRVLVYEGVVRESFLQETILLNLTADGRALERAQSLNFNFEIEMTP